MTGLSEAWTVELDAFCEHLAELGRMPRTARTHAGYLRRLAQAQPGPWLVTAEDVRVWLDGYGGGLLAARAAARSFYGWAHRTGRIGQNPAAEAVPVKLGTARVSRGQDLPPGWVEPVAGYATFLAGAGRRPKTIRLYRMHLGMFARTHPDPVAVTEAILLGYLAGQRLGPETRRSARSALRNFYSWAHRRAGLVPVDPAAELPAIRVPAGRPHPTPSDVVTAALDRADDKGRLMLLLGAYAGLRRAEIAAVHPGRDLADGVLYVTGKGGRRRFVPVHPVLGEAIEAELLRRRSGRFGTGWRYVNAYDVDGYLFPGLRTGTHCSVEAVGETLSGLLGEHWTAHGLRHRFASRAYAGSLDLRAVQELLGHSSLATTQRYTAVPDGALRNAVLSIGL